MEEARHDGGRSVAERVAAALERLANAHRRLVQDVATSNGLSPLQVQVLGLLCAGPPPAPRGSALSRELGVSQPTVSDAVAALRVKGLADQMPDPVDRRASVLALTPVGQQIAARLESAGDPMAAAVASLPPRQQEEVLLALLRLIGALADAGIVGVARTCLTCRFHKQRRGADHCALLDLPLPVAALRVNCPEHQARPASSR